MASIENEAELVKAETQLWKHHFGFMDAACIECAMRLGIPDAIHNHGKPITLSHLVESISINPTKSSYVNRIMKILVGAEFVMEEKSEQNPDQEKCFSLTSAGHLLLSDGPKIAKGMFPLLFCVSLQKPWAYLSDFLKGDAQTPFEMAHGMSFWNYFGQDPSLQRLFNDAMAGESEYTAKVLTEHCGFAFEGVGSLVDVGGGTGTTSRIIAKKFPSLNCLVFDLPHVVANQQGSENLNFVGGSMFDEIPIGDAILLKWILHNWTDEESLLVLKNCKNAISSKGKGGKLIVIDIVMGSHEGLNKDVEIAQNYFDMQMFVVFDSKERTEKEFATLFEKAGFSGYKVHPFLGVRSLIEVYP